MYLITKEFRFESAHRLLHHGGKCKHLHGHSYKASVTLQREELATDGMVVDFSEVSKIAKEWIDKNWDHNTILNALDPLMAVLGGVRGTIYDSGKAPYEMACEPTAENLARKLWSVLAEELNQIHISGDPHVSVTSVTIWETATSCATYTHDYRRE